ncbi:MAG TPA: hypothetical protein VHM91_07800, partial [Verrucomicrobiales bacterium]|nr:hypothetical protein [Verrucomicrobiales bacterium]
CSTIAHAITENMTLQEAGRLPEGLPPRIRERALLVLAGRATTDDLSASAVSLAEVLQRNAGDEGLQKEGAGIAADAVQRMVHDEAPREAAVWVQALPAGTAKTAATEKLVSEWAEADAAAASEWVTALPAGEVRGAAVNALIEAIAGSEPERALEWAKSIPAAGPRTEQIGRIMRQWLPAAPFAAMRAVEALPEEVRFAIWSQEE